MFSLALMWLLLILAAFLFEVVLGMLFGKFLSMSTGPPIAVRRQFLRDWYTRRQRPESKVAPSYYGRLIKMTRNLGAGAGGNPA